MCGFAGLLHAASTEPERLGTQVSRMADALRHRGPDDDGAWGDKTGRVSLGFRRLSILDLSDAGRQPMTSPSGRYGMVFNGEVYNFRSLRKELEALGTPFRGGSDSEVVLAAVDRWGLESALPRMVGMFAIALWDKEEEELLLVRDRMGIKPLYLARTRYGVAFASELGALTRAPGFVGTLDPVAIVSYLRYLYFPAPLTPFREARKLPPGHLLRIPKEKASDPLPDPEAYWDLREVRRRAETSIGSGPSRLGDAWDERKVDELQGILADAVEMRLIADVPVGALLSGGIDSSLVVSLMQEAATEPVRTFTIGFDDPVHDESAYARAIAEHLGTVHTELFLTGEDALGVVPDLPRIFDEPLADPSQVPTFLVSRLARNHVTVALSGDGGDELFGGYNRYTSGLGIVNRLAAFPLLSRRWMGLVLSMLPPELWGKLHRLVPGSAGDGPGRLWEQKVEKLSRIASVRGAGEMYRTLVSAWDRPEDLVHGPVEPDDQIRGELGRHGRRVDLSDVLLLDQRFYLPDDLLQKVDRASMAVSLEVRVPILDHRVVEFSWTLPDDLKIRDGQGKWILRQLLDRYVPRELMERPKTGFSVPIEGWLRGPLRPWAEELLLGHSDLTGGIFDRAKVQLAWNRFLSGRTNDGLALWTLVMFEAWRREWGMGDLHQEVA